MIRYVKTQLIVENHNNHNMYYPRVVSASVTYSYPFSIPQAEITIAKVDIENYISPLRFDDIVVLNVSVKMNPGERTIWQPIFLGRIEKISADYADENKIVLSCVGHLAETKYALIYTNKDWTTTVNAKDIIEYIMPAGGRVVYSATYTDVSQTFPEYHIKQGVTYRSEVLEEIEKMGGFKHSVNVVPVYTDGRYDKAYLWWNLIPTTPTVKFKIVEGTPRLLKATFEISGEDFFTYVNIIGGTADGATTPFGDDAIDNAGVSAYGQRATYENHEWVMSNQLCQIVAQGLLSDYVKLDVTGQVTIIGTPEAALCDMVYVMIPSLELNGAYVDGNFTIYRVQHNIDEGSYTTTLDLGRVKKDAYDYINQNITKVLKTCKKNQACKK